MLYRFASFCNMEDQTCRILSFPHIIVWVFLFFFSAYPFPSPPPTLSHATLSHTTDSHTALSDTTLPHRTLSHDKIVTHNIHPSCSFLLLLQHSSFVSRLQPGYNPAICAICIELALQCFVSDFNVTFFEYFLILLDVLFQICFKKSHWYSDLSAFLTSTCKRSSDPTAWSTS